MRTVRLPLLRGALFIIALAAIAFIMARGDNPASATSYDPHLSISVSDPNPGAAADIAIDFSLDAPDAFPNVKTKSSVQFLPKAWGISDQPVVGAIGGTFNALSTIGLVGLFPCVFPVPVPFTMYDASVDTTNVTSALDIGGGVHPGGIGYSGQFAQDPDTLSVPADLGMRLINFNADEKNDKPTMGWPFEATSTAYRDVDNSGNVTPGDVRLTDYHDVLTLDIIPAGTVVQLGDLDLFGRTTGHPLWPFLANEKHADADRNDQMDAGEGIYRDVDGSGTVSYGDIRLFNLGQLPFGSTVQDFGMQGGITRYPDFLNQMFPPAVVGQPLARQFGAQQVVITAVSLNIVTYRPGQLPGYPASLGYPNVVVLLNPVAPVELYSILITSDLCAPLSLTSTNFGVSQDNPATFEDETGNVRLTNPKSEKDHTFTLITTSQPDADNDGIENMLDTCPLDPNVGDLNGRDHWILGTGPFSTDPDIDGLDSACDPDPENPSPFSPAVGMPDEDLDSYANRADNCATVANGIELLGLAYQQVPGFTFFWAIPGDLIGPSNQIDSDSDDIGDACDPDPYNITGHMHVVTLTQGVPIFKHGVKLNNLGGPPKVKDSGARTYNVDVSNLSGSDSEDVQVALQVLGGCGTVNGDPDGMDTAVVSVGPGGSGTASFTVDWTDCPPGLDPDPYVLRADACHAGDPAPAGLFGSGACPGASDGKVDSNPLDDVYMSMDVEVGSP